jgi:hypothetical protein
LSPFSVVIKNWWKNLPSPFMTEELRYKMGEAAKKAASADQLRKLWEL